MTRNSPERLAHVIGVPRFEIVFRISCHRAKRRSRSIPQHVVERKDGKTGSRCALRARDGSRCGRRGRPVLQEPVLGAADSKRRNCHGVRGILSEVPEASMSAAAAMRAFNASGCSSITTQVVEENRRPRARSNGMLIIRHTRHHVIVHEIAKSTTHFLDAW